MINKTSTTNMLLLAIVIPIVFYLLKTLSFIFIPLIFSMFIALLFLPLMRWFNKRKVPKILSIFVIILIIGGILKITGELVQLSSKQIFSSENLFFEKAEVKLTNLLLSIQEFLGLDPAQEGLNLKQFFKQGDLFQNLKTTLGFVGNLLTTILMTAFFVVLWLAESINVQKVLNYTILRQKFSSIKAFGKIEKDLIKFLKVKFLMSLFTGIGTGLACLFFDVSFPIFWGLFAFVINFVQMVGSFVSVILLSIFSFVELDPTSTLLFFILTITGVQVLFGAILEPIFMGKSFSMNIITVLVVLMFWGFLWGVPGLIMAIPITVFVKIILEQFPNTKRIAGIMSASRKK